MTTQIEHANGHGPDAPTTDLEGAPANGARDRPRLVPWPLREPVDAEPADAVEVDQADEDERDDELGEPVDLVPLLPEPIRAPRRFVVRHVRHVALGTRVYAGRRRDARSTARHERMIRLAEAAGDHASALEWETRAAAFRKERHARRMALLRAPVYAARAVIYTASTLAGALIALGLVLAVTSGKPAESTAPLQVAFRVVWWICWAVDVAWRPALVAAPVLILASLWTLGRAHAPLDPVLYAEGGDGDGRELVPDESAILTALRHLGIGPLDKAVKAGWQPRWLLGAVEDGAGWHAQLMLPQGVSVEMINRRKNLLASNLLRKPIEVWPSEPDNKPGVLDLWVAHPGTLTGPVPPWPLLKTGTADYFKGVPVAVTLRGEAIRAGLMAKNYMIGGIMGTGKSSATRAIVLGAALDPLVEIEVYVMAYNADYDLMRPRLSVLVKGDEDEDVEKALKALRRLRSEVTRRGQLLEEAGELKLTRELAARDKRMRPRVVVFDECHELFMHKTYGAEAAELAEKVMKKARKTGITLVWVTVSPAKDSIPKEVTRNTSNRVAFAVGDHYANDGLLGTGKHRSGITATTLNPSTDIGTSVTVGFTANPFDIARWQYLSDDDVPAIIDRACKARAGIERTALDQAPTVVVDHLADVLAVLGDEPRMRTTVVLQRLASLRPEVYEGWSGERLKAVLIDADPELEPHKSNGNPVVDAAKLRAVLGRRDDEPSDRVDDDQAEDDGEFE
ncbi:MAG TPA: FtsK/SpoIIIE domain-containing protein [Actinocrinis sp.]|uniref:FtsK/SpoIIIE domain-containing protein n=1 Tax=Actinocrinis sp. TaxID=1920516 RepID=UPI002DDCB6EE|nr:FtsK/SpoIIIE domain-containing protein [Actinocrinis sp.]HEV2345217.1 FtsK/SpoIIIE domain-containing protein [Actinocrinis sp.]